MRNTLRILDAGGYCGIDQAGITQLHLTELNAENNNKITTLSFNNSYK